MASELSPEVLDKLSRAAECGHPTLIVADRLRALIASARRLAECQKELAALHGPASRDFTPSEIIRIASKLGLCNDDVKRQPTFGKIAAAVSRLSEGYAEHLDLKRRLAECEAALRIADEALSVCVGNNADTRHKRAEARQQIATALSNQGAADAASKP